MKKKQYGMKEAAEGFAVIFEKNHGQRPDWNKKDLGLTKEQLEKWDNRHNSLDNPKK